MWLCVCVCARALGCGCNVIVHVYSCTCDRTDTVLTVVDYIREQAKIIQSCQI